MAVIKLKNQINNPVAEDRSLYEQPAANPITIPAATTVTDISNIDWSTLATSDDLDVYAENLRNILPAGQTSYPYKKTTQDPPEDIPFVNNDDVESGGLVSSVATNSDDSDDSATGPPLGLNKDPKSTSKIGNPKDAKGIQQSTGVFDADLSVVKINPRPNELNKFSSYNYNIALYMINSKSYVNLLTAPNSPQAVLDDSLLLMKSGGSGTGPELATERSLGFFNDFFIDDLELTSLAVGPSKFNQNTNVTEIKFNITEPRGVTLLEKLRDAAGTTLVSTKEKYISAPYIMEIKFKGFDERGQPMAAPSKPKYIPIKITDIQFDVTESGTQYRVQAIPFAHNVFGQIASTIPMNVELTAGSIGNIFSEGLKSFTTETEETRVDDGGESEATETVTKTKYGDSYKTLADVMTDYQKKRTKDTIKKSPKIASNPGDKSGGFTETTIPAAAEKYDTYEFMIASEIANSKLNIDAIFDALDTPAPTGQKKDDGKANKSQFQAYAEGFRGTVSLDKDKKTFKINAGTDITKLLNLVIMHSDYMDKNVIENAEKGVTEGKPIKWFKVKPVIKSAEGPGQGFDGKDGRYKYHIMYVVEPSVIYYHDFPWASKSKPKGNGFHKIYDYIFSGKNTEVLDFKLKFRAAFLQVMTAGTGKPFGDKTADQDFSAQTKEIPNSPEGNTVNGQDNVTRARAKDLFSSVMSDGVDMIELDMQIIGDPAYIATSDAYWQDKVRQGQQYTDSFMPDGTINYDLTAPYVQVNLKTPIDYDDITGLANPNTATNSSFSGIYKLNQVSSTFSGGIFQQKLKGLRAPVQPEKGGVAISKSDNAGKDRKALIADDTKATQLEGSVPNTGEYGGLSNNSTARVVNPFENNRGIQTTVDSETAPYTSPRVNNARTAAIAQGADQSVQTIPDVNADTSSSWTPPANFFKNAPARLPGD